MDLKTNRFKLDTSASRIVSCKPDIAEYKNTTLPKLKKKTDTKKKNQQKNQYQTNTPLQIKKKTTSKKFQNRIHKSDVEGLS